MARDAALRIALPPFGPGVQYPRVALTVASRFNAPLAASGFPKESTVIEVFVESIRVNMTNYKRVVMLKEKTAQRYLPIWIGHFEADAIAIPMQNVPVSRPLTHDLLGSVITSLGGKVTQVVINELADETFFAKLIIDDNGRHVEVDSRPSDAIALAIRAKVPIFVEDAVLDQAGMVFESEGEGDEASPEPRQAPAEVIDESKLGVFKEFIETLDLGDLGRGGGSEKPERT
jgi:bifunctional DNase/RNase